MKPVNFDLVVHDMLNYYTVFDGQFWYRVYKPKRRFYVNDFSS